MVAGVTENSSILIPLNCGSTILSSSSSTLHYTLPVPKTNCPKTTTFSEGSAYTSKVHAPIEAGRVKGCLSRTLEWVQISPLVHIQNSEFDWARWPDVLVDEGRLSIIIEFVGVRAVSPPLVPVSPWDCTRDRKPRWPIQGCKFISRNIDGE